MKKIPGPDPLNDFPKSDMWLLFIDGHRLNEGPFAFDRDNPFSRLPGEPGYIESMKKAWFAAMDLLDQDLSTGLVRKIHDISISNIPQLEGYENFREGSCSFGLFLPTPNDNVNEATLSLEGLKELILELNQINTNRLNSKGFPANCIVYVNRHEDGIPDKTFYVHFNEEHLRLEQERCLQGQLLPENAVHILFSDFENIISQNNTENGNFILLSSASKRQEIADWLQSDILTYAKEISVARKLGNEDQIIHAIAQFTRRCLQGHYFYDGNGRTFVNVLMNFLLVQNGLSPAILMSPNHLSGFSLNECVSEVKEGIKMFRDFSVSQLCEKILKAKYKDVKKSPDEFKQQIIGALSSHPLARLAQLNEVYQRMISGDLTMGNKLTLKWTKEKMHGKTLEILCEIYREEFNNLRRGILPGEDNKKSHIRSMDALMDLVSNHKIAQELRLAEEIAHAYPQKHEISKQ